MRRFLSAAALSALLLTLCACNASVTQGPEPVPTPTVEATATPEATVAPEPEESLDDDPWPEAEPRFTKLDLSSYEGELSEEEWEALQGFFPVLNNEVPMLLLLPR